VLGFEHGHDVGPDLRGLLLPGGPGSTGGLVLGGDPALKVASFHRFARLDSSRGASSGGGGGLGHGLGCRQPLRGLPLAEHFPRALGGLGFARLLLGAQRRGAFTDCAANKAAAGPAVFNEVAESPCFLARLRRALDAEPREYVVREDPSATVGSRCVDPSINERLHKIEQQQ
jgi:hypothetical protein